jgi:hypothetical protein
MFNCKRTLYTLKPEAHGACWTYKSLIWKLFMFKKLLPLLFLFAGFQANATLIDNGNYSTDVESGLDWLDWTLTLNKTQAEALTLFSGAGWRIATAGEAVALIKNQLDVSIGHTGYASSSISPNWAVDSARFFDLFGRTSGTESFSTIEGFGLLGIDTGNAYAGLSPGSWGAVNRRASWMGVALVKVAAVPEPSIIALFGLGLVGIGFARRKRQS